MTSDALLWHLRIAIDRTSDSSTPKAIRERVANLATRALFALELQDWRTASTELRSMGEALKDSTLDQLADSLVPMLTALPPAVQRA